MLANRHGSSDAQRFGPWLAAAAMVAVAVLTLWQLRPPEDDGAGEALTIAQRETGGGDESSPSASETPFPTATDGARKAAESATADTTEGAAAAGSLDNDAIEDSSDRQSAGRSDPGRTAGDTAVRPTVRPDGDPRAAPPRPSYDSAPPPPAVQQPTEAGSPTPAGEPTLDEIRIAERGPSPEWIETATAGVPDIAADSTSSPTTITDPEARPRETPPEVIQWVVDDPDLVIYWLVDHTSQSNDTDPHETT